ncbi:inactive histone-lysine N-methyltransferase 2E-like isoform X2 [Anneissia japonica]|uniref:inactive histone-lysine N-methyltransferase 2E-like isoform X2 n=1 Tax=Anneissia japonica TaxID=1529436 RepID=UPI0014255FDA|nr:inactive histone-lysine N-methyltransferase 2E-like isoform X2 [Anneissia japonica]
MVNKCVMSITLNLLATAADSAPYATMAAGSDPEAVEDPVATGDAKTQSQPSNHTPANLHHSHYIGLPYQDHNYGAPPPPTPPASPPPKLQPVSPSKKLNGFLDSSNVSTLSNATNSADDGVTRCICNFEHDDGYMISCDQCLSWQHVECMGLDRNNIPERYFCEKCEPRSVDVQKAVALQTKKRENMSDSSSTDSEESTAVNPTTYTAISNSPTSLTLTTHHKNKKSKKKKRKREHSERSHKKKKKKHDKKSRTRSLSSELNLFDEDAQVAWIQSEHSDEYEDASKNEYTAELQKFLAAVKPDIECTVPHSRLRAQFADIGAVSIGRKGLIAKERIMEKQTILEYRGKVMLKKQLLTQTAFFSPSYRYTLFYSRFGNIDICVDARVYGNKARYVRRSCSPNTEVLHNTEGDLIRLFLVSCKEIPKDSEITIGFDISHKECPFPLECACGKKNCAVKKHHKHRHESGDRKKNHKNNHIKKEDSNSCGSHPAPLSARRRTVSPLRVSLSTQLVQNSVIDITPAKMTDDEEMQTEVDVETEENQPESNRKLTREERKMEAIMKAFEKMERTQKRRQQALDRLAIAKDNESPNKAKPLEEVAQTTDVIQVDQSNEETLISSLQQAEAQPNAAAKPPVVKRKKKTRYNSTPRRRTRNNSAASTISTEIKPLDQSLSSLPATPITSMPSFFSSNSSPARTHGVVGLINNNDRLLPLVSPVTCNSKHFKFPKTKKLFLNEWLNEKAQEACVDNPLSISTDPVDIVDSASPNTNSHSQLARSNSLSALVGKVGPEASLGSAKKRWLRLAMNEAGGGGGGDSPVGSGALSPSGILAGSAMSPKNETITPLKKRWLRISVSDDQSTALCSAATSASSSPLHPSLDTDCTLPSTSSVLSIYPKPNVSIAVEENLLTTVASSSLILKSSEDILKEDQKIETNHKQLGLVDYSNDLQTKCKEKNDSNQQDLQAVELIFSPAHKFQEGSGTIKPLPLALPAKKDFRKNSSIDSGLSVTTPMDISESPKYFPTDNVHNITDQNKIFNSSENAVVIVPRTLMQSEHAPLNELLTETKPSIEALHLHSKSDQNRPNRPSLSTERTLVSSEGSILAKAELDINKSLSSSHGTVYSLGSGDASQTDLQESVSSLSDFQQSWSSVSEYAVPGNSKSLNHMDKDHLGNDIIAQTAQGTMSDGLNVSQRVSPNTVRTLNFQSPKKIGPDSARSSLDDQTSDLSQSNYTSPKKRALMFIRESENPKTVFSAGWRDSASEKLPQRTEIENKLQENCLGEKTDGGKPVPSTPTSMSLNIGSGIPSVQPLPYPIEGVVTSQVNSGTVAPIAQLSHYPAGGAPVSSETGIHHPPCPVGSRPGVPVQSLSYSVGSANSTPVKVSHAGSSGLPEGTPPVTPPVGSQSPAGTPAVKKKVSLLEYRKRKTTAKPTPASSDPSTPVKSLTSSLSKSTENTPVKMPTTLATLPLFDTPPPVEKDISGKGLRLSTEAEKAISSLTSLLKDTGSKTDAGESRRSSVPVAENAVTQYKGLSEKMSHRIGPNHNLKRSHSPEPPPPPPNKKHNLQLHIPPPPPPKSKATVDSRGGFNNTDSTPPPPFGRQNSYQASPVASASARNNTGMQLYPQQSQYHASSSSSPRGHQTSLTYPVQSTRPSQVNSNQPLNTTFLGYHEQGNLAPAPTHQSQSTSQQYYNETYQVFPQQPTNVAPQGVPQGVNFQQQHRPQGAKPTFSKQSYGQSFSPRRGYYQSQ